MMKKLILCFLLLILPLTGCSKPEAQTKSQSKHTTIQRTTANELLKQRHAVIRVSRSENRKDALHAWRVHQRKVRAIRVAEEKRVRYAKIVREKKRKIVSVSRKVEHVALSGIAARIAKCESGGNPKAENAISTASGLYQFIDGTWNNFGGYSHASFAPASVQTKKFYIVWNNGAGAGNWAPSRSCWG